MRLEERLIRVRNMYIIYERKAWRPCAELILSYLNKAGSLSMGRDNLIHDFAGHPPLFRIY